MRSPLAPHVASPAELQERWRALETGKPFLIWREGEGEGVQRIRLLSDGPDALTIGRRETCDVALPWDKAVSRTHARVERVGSEWTVIDDGLSANGTYVNGARLTARRRLAHEDLIEIGDTIVAFCHGAGASLSEPTIAAVQRTRAPDLTPAQTRVLTALCRPLLELPYAAPASNQQIADELVVTTDAVKRTLKTLFASFEIDNLPQNQKRAALARAALRSGVVS